jgi:glycosyltransferase involved in cell wall biosynthesis
MKPLVSIVMPCFNVEKFLPYAFWGLEELEYENFEVVMVDDGSSDRTAELIKSNKSLNILYIENEANIGLASSINKGISASNGEFIARLDADDFTYSHRLNSQVSHLLENTELSVVGSGADVFGNHGAIWRCPNSHREILDHLLIHVPIIHPTVMFRREVLDEGDLWYNEDLKFDEDYELWLRLIDKYKFHNLDYSTIRYRLHDNNYHKHPGYKEAKRNIIRNWMEEWCEADILGVRLGDIVDALVDYQMSGYISMPAFHALRAYAVFAELHKKPKLGWLQGSLLNNSSYPMFMEEQYAR